MTEKKDDKKAHPRGLMGKRSVTRLFAIQALFQLHHMEEEADLYQVLLEFANVRLNEGNMDGVTIVLPDDELFVGLVKGTWETRDEIDTRLIPFLKENWTIDRLEPVILAILRIAIYELHNSVNIAAALLIGEYADLAQAFYGKSEVAFINGILQRMAPTLRDDIGYHK